MELKWLEDLIMLLDEKSISRAAQRRHITQPAYSRRIRQLEQWLGVELVDRSTKPISIRDSALDLEDGVRDLINRFYSLRSNARETRKRVIFIAQHTLAISRFPALIQEVKQQLPESSYCVVSANYEECEAMFYAEADFLLCYQSAQRRFDFSHSRVGRVDLGRDYLIPVASSQFIAQHGSLAEGGIIPLLMYQRGGFFAELVAGHCLPAVMREHRVETVCETAFSASLKEMVLAHMGVAWLAHEIVQRELEDGSVVNLADEFGSVALDIVLYYKDEPRARRIAELISQLD